MKQLTCEMCGSTDLMKQDGVFVCQTCGCKYSVEEAKKMMVEGTVNVQGVVKIDNSEAYANYLQLANDAFMDARFDSAYTAVLEALKTTPEAPLLIARQALSILGKEGFITTIPGATSNGVDRAIDLARKNLPPEEMSVFAATLDSDVDAVCGYIRKGLDDEISGLNAQKMPTRSALDILADLGRPVFVVEQYQRDDKIKEEHNKKIDSQIAAIRKRIQTLDSFRDMCKKRAGELRSEAQAKAAEIRRREQQERNKKYWNEHAEERSGLIERKSQLESRIHSLTDAIAAIEARKVPIESQISDACKRLESERDSVRDERRKLEGQRSTLGMFKGKEKKRLTEEIAALNEKASQIERSLPGRKQEIREQFQPEIDSIDAEIKPLREERSELQKQLKEVDTELNKDR